MVTLAVVGLDRSCPIHQIHNGSQKAWRFITDRDGLPGRFDPSKITDYLDRHTGSHFAKRLTVMGHRDLSWMVTSLATRYESGVSDNPRVDTISENFLTGILSLSISISLRATRHLRSFHPLRFASKGLTVVHDCHPAARPSSSTILLHGCVWLTWSPDRYYPGNKALRGIFVDVIV